MTTPAERGSNVPLPDAPRRSIRWKRRLKLAAKAGMILLACFVVGLAVVGQLSKDRIEIPPNHLGRYINVQGEKIRCYTTGTGPDILLIHGLPGIIEDWNPIFEAAAGRYRVTAYDRPGHGYSAESSEYTLAHNADVALGLIEQLRLKDVIVVGHSFGGGIVLAMAARNPPQVKAFISLGGVTAPGPEGFTVFDLVRLPLVGRGLAAIGARILGDGMVRSGMQSAFSPNESLLTREILDQRIRVSLQTKVVVALAREAGAFNADVEMVQSGLSAMGKPLHFIHGENDKLVPVEQVKAFHDRFPSTGLTLLRNTGHCVQFAHPEAVMAAIDSLSKR